MKIWLDDERPVPDDSWTLVKKAYEAMRLLRSGDVEVISFDHDLGKQRLTGYDVVSWLEYVHRADHVPIPKEMRCHSANPVGRERIELVIRKIREFQEERGEGETKNIG